MKMKLSDGKLYLAELNSIQFQTIKAWGLMRWNRQQQVMEGAATVELLERLERLVPLPEIARQELQRQKDVAFAVDRERMVENPKPVYPYPVKYKMYLHQIRACNMALLVFGLKDPTLAVLDDLKESEV